MDDGRGSATPTTAAQIVGRPRPRSLAVAAAAAITDGAEAAGHGRPLGHQSLPVAGVEKISRSIAFADSMNQEDLVQ